MFRQPCSQCGRHNSSVLSLLGDAEGFLGLEVRLDVVEEGQGKGIALVEVREVDIETCFGVFVREQARVVKFPAEDCTLGGWCKQRVQ